MKLSWFHLMPYRFLPEDFKEKYRSVWVDVPSELYDAEKTHRLYHEFLDELEFAEQCGFDGLCVNEHHQNAYGLMPSPNLMAAALSRRATRRHYCLGEQHCPVQSPVRIAEEFAYAGCHDRWAFYRRIPGWDLHGYQLCLWGSARNPARQVP